MVSIFKTVATVKARRAAANVVTTELHIRNA